MPAARSGSRSIEFLFPLRGIHNGTAQEQQARYTSPDMLNVEGFDKDGGRARGAQRAGCSKWSRVNLAGSQIDALHFTGQTGTSSLTTPVLELEDFRTAAAPPGQALNAFHSRFQTVFDSTGALSEQPMQLLAGGTAQDHQTGGVSDARAQFDGTTKIGSLTLVNAADSAYCVPVYTIQDGGFTGTTSYSVNALITTDVRQTGVVQFLGIAPTALTDRKSVMMSFAQMINVQFPGPVLTFNGAFEWLILVFRDDSTTYSYAGVQIDASGAVTTNTGNTSAAVPSIGTVWTDMVGKLASGGPWNFRFGFNSADNTLEAWIDELLVIKTPTAAIIADRGLDLTRKGIVPAAAAYGQPTLGAIGVPTAFTATSIEIDFGTTTTAVPAILPKVIAAAGGKLYVGAGLSRHEVGGAGSTFLRNYPMSICDADGKAYAVDSTTYVRQLDLASGVFKNLAAQAGKGSVPTAPTIAVIWRNRLCLAQAQNLFMSRSGQTDDWLYGQDDALSAFELNASANAGRIGAPILALVPFRDDNLVIGCDHAIFNLAGDPASSDGQLVTVSEQIGMYGQRAWCIDPNGTLWFVGTGGLYRMDAAGTGPQLAAAHHYDSFFAAIDRDNDLVQCCYDRDNKRVYIFVTDRALGGGAPQQRTGVYYDVNLDAFFPLQLPMNIGPYAAIVYDGQIAADRRILLGSRDGYVRQFDKDSETDDGAAIVSHVAIGPVQPFGAVDDGIVEQIDGIIGALTGSNVVAEMLVGNSAENAIGAAPQPVATWTSSGRQSRVFTRYRGNTFYLKLSNSVLGKRWALESVSAQAVYGGIQR